VEYALPFSPATITVDIYSDYLSDGDIANDPYLGFIVTRWPDTRGTIFFGSTPGFRTFHSIGRSSTSPSTDRRMAVIPLDASIVSATLDLFVNSVSFADTIPADIDLVFFSRPPA